MGIKASPAPQQIRVLQKTLDILEAIKKKGTAPGLAELTRPVGMPNE